MVWAGLRGAVGVTMALFIFLDQLILDERYKALCLFFMALMAFITVLLNGSTTKLVLQVRIAQGLQEEGGAEVAGRRLRI
jgi:NhaP-type Na+/H+ or K+/H+ antiporter